MFWGTLHGVALMIHRAWKSFGFTMNKYLAWFITFNFVNIAWIFFRAKEWKDAIKVIRGMLGLNGIIIDKGLESVFFKIFPKAQGIEVSHLFNTISQSNGSLKWVLIVLVLSLVLKNSHERIASFRPTKITALFAGLLFVYGLFNTTKVSEFLYFNF